MKDLLELMKGRRSVLRFKSNPTPNAGLEKILKAGRWTPSYAK